MLDPSVAAGTVGLQALELGMPSAANPDYEPRVVPVVSRKLKRRKEPYGRIN